MSRYLQFKKAQASKVYREIVTEVEEALTSIGYFHKATVLTKLGYDDFDDAIRWDYVKRMVEEQYKTELICLAEAFFKRHSKEDERHFPAKYTSTGHGKRAHGFAIASPENGHFVIQRLRVKHNIMLGAHKSANRLRSIAQQAGVANLPAPTLQITDGTNDAA